MTWSCNVREHVLSDAKLSDAKLNGLSTSRGSFLLDAEWKPLTERTRYTIHNSLEDDCAIKQIMAYKFL